MLMVAIILFGWISYMRLGISQLPDVDFPVVSISLTLPGAAPEVVESQALDPIEDAVMQIDGIRSVTSTAQQSSGRIGVEFELNRNIDESMEEIQDRINQVQNVLPVNMNPPSIRKSNPEDQPILWLALTSDDPTTKPIDLMIYARNFLFNQFSTISGVGDISMGGYVDPALRVWVDMDKLDKYNFTSDELLDSVKNGHVELPAGMLSNDKTEYNVRMMGEATSVKDFGDIMIDSRAGLGPNYRLTTLKEVSTIEEGLTDVRKVSRFNRKRAVGLGILKQHGSNAVEVGRLVRERLKEIQPLIPKGYHVDLRSDNTRFVKQAVDELLFTLLLSALLTSIVCYLFLGSWTSTINVLMAIPTSIVGTFTAFYFFNFTLNTFTLLGLSLAIGIVVDDAIMMLENIVRHRELGESKRQAALKGSKEITFAALAATLAIVAIFLPVVFMKGVIGRYFLQYGITVTIAVLLSLLEALTLTPMRCSRYLTVDPHPKGLAGFVDRVFAKLSARYRGVLEVLLAHRLKTLIITIIVFVASCFLTKLIPSEMMPAQDQAMIMMRFKLPVGSSLGLTDSKIAQVEDYLMKQPEVSGVYAAVGGFGGDSVNQGNAFVTFVDRDKRKATQAELIARFRNDLKPLSMEAIQDPRLSPKSHKGGPGGGQREADSGQSSAGQERTHGSKFQKWQVHPTGTATAEPVPSGSPPEAHAVAASTEPTGKDGGEKGPGGGKGGRGGKGKRNKNKGFQINIQDLSLRGFASGRGYPVEFIIQGPDWDKLNILTNQVMDAMQSSGLVTDTDTDIQPGMPEVQLTPNRQKLATHGVSLNTLTGVINALVGGAILNKETEYSKGGHRYQIGLRLLANQRDQVPELNRIKIRNNRGQVIPVSDLVDLQINPSLMLITRLNRARSITVYANPAPGVSQEKAMKGVEKLARSMLPGGYSIKMTGSSQSFRESFDSLIYAMALGLLVSYMVLASQFNSFIHPITVLMALPFSFSGAFVGLLLFHQSINIFSLIGFILLMGIVKKNSILLVDFTNQCRAEGADVRNALLKACPVRLRPIVMTSVATVAGALPEAISLGPGAETTIPMAVAIIGGVVASTILTLFVVPCVYSLLSRFESVDPLEKAEREAALAAKGQPLPA